MNQADTPVWKPVLRPNLQGQGGMQLATAAGTPTAEHPSWQRQIVGWLPMERLQLPTAVTTTPAPALERMATLHD